jgi:hypothetical protein
VISQWLAEHLESAEQLVPALAQADRFAEFLDSYIDFADPAASLKMNDASTAWRAR